MSSDQPSLHTLITGAIMKKLSSAKQPNTSAEVPSSSPSGTSATNVIMTQSQRNSGGIYYIIECPICMERMIEPRMLPCQHTFCYTCIRRHFDTAKGPQNGQVRCPICKKLHVFNKNAGKGKKVIPPVGDELRQFLQTNYTLISLLDYIESREKAQATGATLDASLATPQPLLTTPVPARPKTPPNTLNVSPHMQPAPISVSQSAPVIQNVQQTSEYAEAAFQFNPCDNCSSSVGSWFCMTCEASLCIQCLSRHLEQNEGHEVYSIEDELDKAARFRARLASTLTDESPVSPSSDTDQRDVSIATDMDRHDEEEQEAEVAYAVINEPPFQPTSVLQHYYTSIRRRAGRRRSGSTQSAENVLGSTREPENDYMDNEAHESVQPVPPRRASSVADLIYSTVDDGFDEDCVYEQLVPLTPLPQTPPMKPDGASTTPKPVKSDEPYMALPIPSPVDQPVVSVPPVPRRAFPIGEEGVKKLFELPDVPRNIAVDCDNNIYVCFEEPDKGIRKFDRDGECVLRFGNAQHVFDLQFVIKGSKKLIVALCGQDMPGNHDGMEHFLQYFDCTTGQMLDTYNMGINIQRSFAVNAEQKLLAVADKENDRINLVDVSKKGKVKKIQVNGGEIVDVCYDGDRKSESLHMILVNPRDQYSIRAFRGTTEKTGIVLEYGTKLLREPKSMTIDRNSHLFVADPQAHCVIILSLAISSSTRSISSRITKADTYAWKPVSVTVLGNILYIADAEHRVVFSWCIDNLTK